MKVQINSQTACLLNTTLSPFLSKVVVDYVDYDADLEPFSYDKLDYSDYQYDGYGNIDMTKPKKSDQRRFRKRKQNVAGLQQQQTTPRPSGLFG